MRIKPTHLRACATILEGDHATAEDAARAVITELDRLRGLDVTFTVVREVGGIYIGTGPFPTINAAVTATERGLAGPPGAGRVAVVPVRTVEARANQLTLLDAQDDDRPANHWTRIRERLT